MLLLVASETGHVYTFATRKLQPMITSETGKALIQTCLNSPDSPPRSDPSTDQRMSATGFEETDLTYQVSEADGCTEVAKVSWPISEEDLEGLVGPFSKRCLVNTDRGICVSCWSKFHVAMHCGYCVLSSSVPSCCIRKRL